MKSSVIYIVFIVFVGTAKAQVKDLFSINNDSTAFELTIKGASHLASLPLKCITQEFPNKTNHTSNATTTTNFLKFLNFGISYKKAIKKERDIFLSKTTFTIIIWFIGSSAWPWT